MYQIFNTSLLIFAKRKDKSWILCDLNNIWKIPQPDQHYYPFTRGLHFIFEYIFLLKAGDRAGYEQDLKESSSEVSRENEALSNMALVVEWEK